MSKNIWLIPAVIIGYILYKKYVLSNKVSASFYNLDFSNVSFSNPEVGLILQINNPTDTTADVQNITGFVIIDGIKVGRVKGITPTKINSGSTLLKVPATLSYEGVSELIKKYSRNGFKLQFVGTITVDYIPLPLEFTYTV